MALKYAHIHKCRSVVAPTMSEEHILYLSSLGGKEVYRDNVPGHFSNDITPLLLNPSKEYEVALHGIFIPRGVYALHKLDEEAVLEIHFEKHHLTINHITRDGKIVDIEKQEQPPTPKTIRKRVFPQESIINIDIVAIVRELNTHYTKILKDVLGDDYSQYLNEKGAILDYVRKKKKVRCLTAHVEGCNNLEYCRITLVFKSRLAEVLGFRPNKHYEIFRATKPYTSGELRADAEPNLHAGVDYLHIYTDIIQPTRFAGQMVNILATLPYGGSDNYFSVQRPLYKKLSKHVIDSIAILFTDQHGKKNYFDDQRSATIVLHIRPTPTSL